MASPLRPTNELKQATPAGPAPRFALVALMLFVSSLLMALAWLGHLQFKESPFLLALGMCWLLVLPEYALNIAALRLGAPVFSGSQMAAFRLCSGVVCVALVARFVLGEELRAQQVAGFALMIVAMALIGTGRVLPAEDTPSDAPTPPPGEGTPC